MYRDGTVPNSNAIAPVKSLLFFHETARIIPQICRIYPTEYVEWRKASARNIV
jgi:hypothetical protein